MSKNQNAIKYLCTSLSWDYFLVVLLLSFTFKKCIASFVAEIDLIV